MNIVTRVAVVFALVVLLAACDDSPSANSASGSSTASSGSMPAKRGEFAMIVRGGQLFSENCATCHGDLAQGAANWRAPGPNGKYPAPPLDGSGHAWHHPTTALVRTIKFGTLAIGGGMPAWKDKLSDEDIGAIIQWFQSRWPEEIYQEWQTRVAPN